MIMILARIDVVEMEISKYLRGKMDQINKKWKLVLQRLTDINIQVSQSGFIQKNQFEIRSR